jgi:hemerythrin-like domain-containing protein
MKATEILEHEHRVIQQVASGCAVCAEALRSGTKVPTDVLESIVDFFGKYGDHYHRQQEEILLSMLREKGDPFGSGPIALINYENRKRRTLVDQLSSAVRAHITCGGEITCRGAAKGMLIETLGALAEFFRGHIWEEDCLLLPMAEKVLSETDKSSLADWLHFIDSKSGAEAKKAVEGFNAALHHCMDAIPQPKQAHAA